MKSLLIAESNLLRDIDIMHSNTSMNFIIDQHEYKFDLHSLIKKKPQCESNIVVIHGTAGSSMSAIKIVNDLGNLYNVHLLDLPGFGRSNMSAIDRSISITIITRWVRRQVRWKIYQD